MHSDLNRHSREELEAEILRLRAELATRRASDPTPSHRQHRSASTDEDVLFSAVDKTGLPMILTDPHQADDPIVFTNRAFLDLTGYSADEIVGRNCRFLQGPDTERDRVDEIRAALRENRDLTLEITNHRQDGTPFVNALFIGPVFDGEGRLRYRFGSQIDVTEAHRNRERLAESEARQRAIFNSASEMAIVVTDPEGRVTDWNVGATRILGWTADEMRGQTIERIFTPEDRASGRAREEMAVVLRDGHAEDVRWHLRKDGSQFYAVGDMTSLCGINGTHQGFVKAFGDRTEQREAAVRHQADAEFMRGVLAASADCIKVLNLDGSLTFMSEGGQKVMEVSDFNAIKGCPWPDFWQGQGNSDALKALATARDGGIGHFQGGADTFLGNPRWWDVQVTPIFGPDGRPERLLSVSRDITAQKSFEERLAASEGYWRSLFENLSEGFLVGEVVRDPSWRITDWRYVDVNAAWSELTGLPRDRVVGRAVREVIPGIEDAWVDEFAGVVESGEPVTFVRQVGTLDRWYEGRAFPLGDERFGVIFLEITNRVKAEDRRNALLSLGDRLRDMNTRSAMTTTAAEIVGQTLGVTRAGYGQVEGEVEFVAIAPDWCAPGKVSIAGRHRFSDFGDIRADLSRGEPLVIDDVLTDPRTREDPGPLQAISVRAQVNMPVRERGRTVAIFIVHDDRPRIWTPEELAFLRNVTDRVEVGIGRVRAEEQQAMLNGELSHRLKNTLAMVQGIAGQTLKAVPDQAPIQAFTERLIALSRAHDVLMQDSWTAAPIRSVVDQVLALQTSLDRFRIEGPNLALAPQATLSLSLLLHELTTNAVKYGALSTEGGRVDLGWRIEEGEEATVALTWREHGGPPATAPTRRGFGARLIQTGLVGTRDTRLDYSTMGLDAEFRAPISQVVAS